MNKPLRTLSPDELGRLGERKFRSLFRSDVSINKSEEDLRGWDFIVELPLTSDETIPFDSRAPHKKYWLQVKTIWEDKTSIKSKLSSAEYIAKTALPSGFLVLKFNAKEQLSTASFIELTGKPLERILSKLRQESTSENPKLNKKYVNFSVAKYGKSIPLNDSNYPLSDYFENFVEDQEAYVLQKMKMLKDMGFKKDIISVGIPNAGDDSFEELALISLGLKTFVPSKLDAQQQRFGISLPHPKLSKTRAADVEITMGPNEGTDISLRLCEPDLALQTDIEGCLHTGMLGEIDAHVPFIFDSTILKITVLGIQSGKSMIEYKVDYDKPYDPSFIKKYCIAQISLNSEKGKIGFVDEENNLEELVAYNSSKNFDLKFYRRLLVFSHALTELNRVLDQIMLFTVREMFENKVEILKLARIAGTSNKKGNWSFNASHPLPSLENINFACIAHVVEIKGTLIAISGRFSQFAVIENQLTFDFDLSEFSNATMVGCPDDDREKIKKNYTEFCKQIMPERNDKLIFSLAELD